jgi:hypothetical protein
VKQLFSNPKVHAVQGASLVEKILVCSAVQLVREGSEEAYFPVSDLIDRAIEILRALNITEPSRAQLLLAHQRLQYIYIYIYIYIHVYTYMYINIYIYTHTHAHTHTHTHTHIL